MTSPIQLAEFAVEASMSAFDAVRGHGRDAQQLEGLFLFLSGLSAYAVEHRVRGTASDLGDEFGAFLAHVSVLVEPSWTDNFGDWADDESSFADAVEDAWNDADFIWPEFISNAGDGAGYLAFPRALKAADFWNEDRETQTLAVLAAAVIIECVAKIDGDLAND